MKEIDFKLEAQEFCRETGFKPVFIIQAAMERAAGLVVSAVHADIKAARASLAKEQASGVSNGETKIIE